jgi:hypothetical protein
MSEDIDLLLQEWLAKSQAPLDVMKALIALMRGRDELAKVLMFALRESGCDGDLCAHEWHEKAREALRKAGQT